MKRLIGAFAVLMLSAALTFAADATPEQRQQSGKERLTKALAKAAEEGRPEWVADTPLEININGDYRAIRRAVDYRFQKGRPREAVKILYSLIDEGEGATRRFAEWYLPQGLIWSDELAFAIVQLRKRDLDAAGAVALGHCYLAYDQYDEALKLFEHALTLAEKSRMKNLAVAQAWRGTGDAWRAREEYEKAKAAYAKAQAAYETEASDPDRPAWYRSRQKVNANRMQALVALSDMAGVDVSQLKPGTYTGSAAGYAGRITVQVRIADGRIASVEVTSERESIALDSLKTVPRRIVKEQSPSVAAVTGATVTSSAVMTAVSEALSKAK